jgi:tRNA 5-methylaminomethyl-2-thiouridine biosynthesis bifunctional protein
MIQTPTCEEIATLSGCQKLEHTEVRFIADAGYLDPTQLTSETINLVKDKLRILVNQEALSLHHDGREWHVYNTSGQLIAHAPCVIIANAFDARQFSYTKWLPLQRVRGQLTFLPTQGSLSNLPCILCHDDGYILPKDAQGLHCLGATYEPFLHHDTVTADSHKRNLDGVNHFIPDFIYPDISTLQGRASFRAASVDHKPLIGPVPEWNYFIEKYGDLYHGTRKNFPNGRYIPGLYVSVGHGSRGLITAPLAGEILAHHILHEPAPVERDILHAVHPARILIRALKKSKLDDLTPIS